MRDDERRPSVAMVTKLMDIQGTKAKVYNYVREQSVKIALPMLEDSGLSCEENTEKILASISEEYMMQAFTHIYGKYFNASDILNLIAFYKTDTGKKLANTELKVITEVSEIAQGIVSKVILMAAFNIAKNITLDDDEKEDWMDLGDLEDPDEFKELF